MFYFVTHKPVDDITKTVSSEFGQRARPNPKASDKHKGIDFAVPIRSKVYAAHNGTVTVVEPNDPHGGKVIEIEREDDSKNKYSTRYLHLSEFGKIVDKETGKLREIRKGDEIDGGTPIALSGNTGSASSGAHLHFTTTVNGKAANPRQYLAQAFPNEFATTVKSGTYGKQLTGDFRDNFLIANSRDNELEGLAGSDTYYLPSLSGSDVIDDVDGNGRIVIGNGYQSVLIAGNALPKTDANGNKIEGVWSLSGFDLHKVNDDLVIAKSGANVAGDNVGKVTVKNFPFSNEKGGFKITLGKKMDKNVGVETYVKSLTDSVLTCTASCTSKSGQFMAMYYNTINILESGSFKIFNYAGEEVKSTSLTYLFSNYQHPGDGYAKPDPQAIISRPGAGPFVYDIDGKKYFAYIVSGTQNTGYFSYSQVGLCLADENGQILKSKIIKSAFATYANRFSGGVRPASLIYQLRDKKLFFLYHRNFPSDIDTVVQQIDPLTLEEIGNSISYGSYAWGREGYLLYNGDSNFLPINNFEFNFDNGAQVIIGSGANYGRTITSIIPKLRDLTPEEIISNQNLASGAQTTNPNIKKQILSFSPDSETNLRISANPNSILALIGKSYNIKSQISLPVDHHSQVEIYSSIDSEYNLDQLLNGEFDFAAAKKLKISRPVMRKLFSAKQEDKILADERSDPELVAAIKKRRDLQLLEERVGVKEAEEIIKAAQRNLDALGLGNGLENGSNFTASNFTNATDDDYNDYYYGGDVDDAINDDAIDSGEINLENLSTPYTIIRLNLADNSTQTVILQGVNATEVAQFPERYFLTQMEITNSPSLFPSASPSEFPSKKPSEQPSNLPSNQPSGIPSYNPSAIPSSQPSNQPSNQPSSQPSGIPSSTPSYHPTAGDLIMPSAIPSELPTGLPTNLPSSQPSNAPSENPSKIPTAKPSLKQYAPSEIPSFNPSNNPSLPPSQEPTRETLNPSNQPSSNSPTSQPSNLPSKSKWPSNQPSLVSKDDSYLPTTKPSIDNFFAQPSLIPTNSHTQKEERPSSIPTSDENDNLSPSQSPSVIDLNSNSPTNLVSSQPTLDLPENDKGKNEGKNNNDIPSGIIAGGVIGLVTLTAFIAGLKSLFSKKSNQVQGLEWNSNQDLKQNQRQNSEEDIEQNNENHLDQSNQVQRKNSDPARGSFVNKYSQIATRDKERYL